MVQNKNIVLCGFMSCGKSTIGKRLAKETGMPFIDMDAYLERTSGMKIAEIFETKGEEFFRELEHQACLALAEQGGCVIATGGGAFTFQRNVEAFKKSGTIVLLDTPLPLLLIRLKKDTSRPLLQKPNREQVIRELYQKRLPVYRQAADVSVRATGTPKTVCAAVLKVLRKKA